MTETPEERRARFAAAMTAAGAKVEGVEAPAPPPDGAAAPAAAQEQPAGGGAPAAAPEGGDSPAAGAAAPVASRWRRKIKALDEEKELDLEKMTDEELDTLLGQGIAYRPKTEHLRQRRDEIAEQFEQFRRNVPFATADQFAAFLKDNNLTLATDPQTKKPKLVPIRPQAAAGSGGAAGQAIDLEALRKTAVEENSAEAWMAYTAGLEELAKQSVRPGDVERIVGEHLAKARQEADATTREEAQVAENRQKIDKAFADRDADFALAGDLKQHYLDMARERAYAASAQSGATLEKVLKSIHDTADLVKRSRTSFQQQLHTDAAKPRATAPTVIPSAGASAPAPTDPAKIDRSTPEGKKQAAAYLERIAAERNQRRAVPA